MDPHAQLEIRSYAQTIGNEIVKRWCPLAWEAFVDYYQNALVLSRIEIEIIRALSPVSPEAAIHVAKEVRLLPHDGEARTRNRERDELEAKLRHLGFSIPWRTDGEDA